MFTEKDKNKDIDVKIKKLLYIICWMVIVICGVWLGLHSKRIFLKILNILSPFFIAGIFAYIFNPIVLFLQDKLHLGRIMGIVGFIIILFSIILLFAVIILPILYNQAVDFVTVTKEKVPQLYEDLSKQYNTAISENTNISQLKLRIKKLKVDIAASIKSMLPYFQTAFQKSLTAVGNIAKGVISGMRLVLTAIALIITSMIICFYILLDTKKIKNIIQIITPDSEESRVFDIIQKINVSLGGFLRGQLIVCVIIGILTTIGLFFIGLKEYALLIGFIAGMANIVPYLGPIMGATPAIIWAIFTTHYTTMEQRLIGAGLIVLLFAFIQTIDGLFISPKVIGKTSELHPLTVILAIIIGSQFGIIGLILSVPAACIVRVLFKEFVWNTLIERERLEKLQSRDKK